MIADTEQSAVFFSWLVRSSAQSCVLIGLILAVQAALRDKLAPRWRYGLWLLVVIRLALPWAPQSKLSVYNLVPSTWSDLGISSASTLSSDAAVSDWPALTDSGHSPVSDHSPFESMHSERDPWAVDEEPIAATAGPRTQPGITLAQVLPLVWLLGAVTVAACALVQSYALAAAIRRQRFLTDQKTLDLLEGCKEEMGVHSYLAVVETSRVKSPALFGFIRPRLLLPAGTVGALGHERLRHVFLHELAHLKRHDIALNWVMTVFQALHWFNPLVWYAFYRARADRELACDALALSRGRKGESCEYGRTIVYLLERFSQRRRLPGLAGVLENQTQVKRRMRMIAQFRKASGPWSALACVLIVVLSGVALTNAQVQTTPESDVNAKVAKLDIDKANLEDVIRIFGKPEKYLWGQETFAKKDLPSRVRYIAVFPKRLHVFFAENRIVEVRHYEPGYVFAGKLQVGSSLEEVLKVIGKPAETVAGKKNEFADGVLYKDIEGRKGHCYYRRADHNVRFFFTDYKVGALYVTRSDHGKDRKAGKSPPPVAKTIQEARKDRPWIPETTTLDAEGRLKDKVDYPFVTDPDVLGTWKVVDFVGEKKEFVPGKKQWRGKLDHLKGMRFDKDGTVAVRIGDRDWRKYGARWTKGMYLQHNTAPGYEITRAGENTHLFFQWKSGDYTIRYSKPAYYVLQKEDEGDAKRTPPQVAKTIDEARKNRPWIPETTTLDAEGRLKDKVDYPFVTDPDVLGTWKVVDFVGEKKEFVPGKKQWRGKLDHLKGMRFDKDGTVAVRIGDRDWRKYGARWTKGMYLQHNTAPGYEITRAGENTHLFFQWKSGDYTIRYSKPAYYVLQRE